MSIYINQNLVNKVNLIPRDTLQKFQATKINTDEIVINKATLTSYCASKLSTTLT